MKFVVMVVCNGKPWKSYVADFLPRVGDTIVDDMDVPYVVTEVVYRLPEKDTNGEYTVSAVVHTEWR